MYVYIYIYICVCILIVCVCLQTSEMKPRTRLGKWPAGSPWQRPGQRRAQRQPRGGQERTLSGGLVCRLGGFRV